MIVDALRSQRPATGLRRAAIDVVAVVAVVAAVLLSGCMTVNCNVKDACRSGAADGGAVGSGR